MLLPTFLPLLCLLFAVKAGKNENRTNSEDSAEVRAEKRKSAGSSVDELASGMKNRLHVSCPNVGGIRQTVADLANGKHDEEIAGQLKRVKSFVDCVIPTREELDAIAKKRGPQIEKLANDVADYIDDYFDDFERSRSGSRDRVRESKGKKAVGEGSRTGGGRGSRIGRGEEALRTDGREGRSEKRSERSGRSRSRSGSRHSSQRSGSRGPSASGSRSGSRSGRSGSRNGSRSGSGSRTGSKSQTSNKGSGKGKSKRRGKQNGDSKITNKDSGGHRPQHRSSRKYSSH